MAQALAWETGEEWDRTRIGRLYYGVFLEFRQFAEDTLGFNRLNLAREHRVISDLLSSLDPSAADDLKLLRIYRNQADYDVELPPEEIAGILTVSMHIADSLMARLEKLRDEQN
ncbi:MAG TPA: hypothetical protein VNZ58_11310 [Thermomicrobiales bacterium]|nr:hypothetical protein [Thermomicrobiales bacterium]